MTLPIYGCFAYSCAARLAGRRACTISASNTAEAFRLARLPSAARLRRQHGITAQWQELLQRPELSQIPASDSRGGQVCAGHAPGQAQGPVPHLGR